MDDKISIHNKYLRFIIGSFYDYVKWLTVQSHN